MPNTREKLFDLMMRDPCPYPVNCNPSCKYYKSHHCHAERYADHLIANGVTISNLETVNKEWIPVSVRLPEKDVKVLTFGVYGFSVNYRDRFSGKWRGVNGKPQWITHWMPLPEAPK